VEIQNAGLSGGGLFLSRLESKSSHRELGKLRRNEEITRANLGLMKMEVEDKKQP